MDRLLEDTPTTDPWLYQAAGIDQVLEADRDT
jgi:hypothetical protein